MAERKKAPQNDTDASSCRQVLATYFEDTEATLRRQADLCCDISEKVRDNSYTADQAQEDWRKCVNEAAEYSQKVTRLWFEGMTRCTGSPGLSWPPGIGDIFGGGKSSEAK